MNCRASYIFLYYFLNYYNYDLFRFFMNLLESSLIINQLLYKIYYQNNVFVFNK